MSLAEYQSSFLQLLFEADAEPHLSRVGGGRFAVYRRMVRRRLSELLELAIPRYVRLVGDRFDAICDAWFVEAPPRSPYLRDAVAEHVVWLVGRGGFPGTPAHTLDLARYEAALRQVEWLGEEVGGAPAAPHAELVMDRPAVLHPARQLVRLGHAVHALALGDDGLDGEAAPGCFQLLVYRDPVSLRPRVLELTPVAARIVEGAPEAPLVEVARAAAEAEALPVDGAFVAMFTSLVADLVERGVWLGSRPPEGP